MPLCKFSVHSMALYTIGSYLGKLCHKIIEAFVLLSKQGTDGQTDIFKKQLCRVLFYGTQKCKSRLPLSVSTLFFTLAFLDEPQDQFTLLGGCTEELWLKKRKSIWRELEKVIDESYCLPHLNSEGQIHLTACLLSLHVGWGWTQF